MSPVNIFEKISIDPPYKRIYSRLGFKKRTTELPAQQREKTDALIMDALSLITLKGCTLKAIVKKNDGKEVVISDDLIFESIKLARYLRDCNEILLMGATAGSNIMDAIKDKTSQDNLSTAVVYDATASEMTDAALDWLMAYANNQLRRAGKILLPRRFSAGYADFKLENQKNIHGQLEMQKIGVTINSNFLLLPEKSVTAITGIYG
ncbi:MAG: Vitamin B12 dependent methionine synthase, activation domain [Smithella sp. PtaU1.Bin162]|nr:MAG: Vitamin B12 dependent methionine synthase, activation domain [Smithella sp. PtaU1.Bin162]